MQNHHSYLNILLCLLLLFISELARAQNPNDCVGAVVICDNGAVSYTPIGPGNQDLDANSTTTCGTSEHQSAWYYFAFNDQMPPNSILEFTIMPNNGTDDYDFAIWGPNVDCGNLGTSIRCNFSFIGITGLVVGGGGPAFEEALTVNPLEGYYLLVDNYNSTSAGFSLTWGGSAAPYLDCDVTPGCYFGAHAGQDILTCTGDQFTLNGAVEGGDGAENIHWTANPPIAVDYLSDTTVLNPTGVIPVGASGPIQYFLAVYEGACLSMDTLEVLFFDQIDPIFNIDQNLCETDDPFGLPVISENGFSGSWDIPLINPDGAGGTQITSIFTIDAGQATCAETFHLVFDIEAADLPSFNIPTALCESDEALILPTTSTGGIEGIWDPASIDPAGQGGQTVSSTFTPTSAFCAHSVDINIDINAATPPQFNLDLNLCASDDPLTLPTTSDEGIVGTWSMPIIDPTGQGGNMLSSTFTPEVGQSFCTTDLTLDFTIEDLLSPEFDPFPILCEIDGPYAMPTISTDGYTGNWAIEIIDPFGQGNASIENIFTPDPGQGACLDEFIGNIEIESELLIEFDIPALCELDDPFVLPSISDNGITGIWTPAVIDPLSLGGTVFSASFQPDALFCAQEYFLDLNIDPADIPEFSLPTVLCEFDDALILPTISDNGVLGMWTDAIIDPTGEGGQTLSSVFIPDDQLFECMEIYTYNVFINPGIVPTFTTVDPLCETDPAFYPDTISLNGVEGQWDPAFIIPADHPDETLVLTFNPNATSCASVTELILDVVSTPEILTLDESNPTDCGSSDGQIIIEAQGTNLEYSIDGGINWNTNADFPNLSGGTYNIQIRSSLNHTCIIEDQVILISPGAPQIDEVITTDPSDCGLEDGSIEIEAAGTSLEYSIDGGNNWQGSNIFQMLAPGDYDIRIREAGSPSCVSSSTALIEEHPGVTLTDVLITDVSNCSVADGQLAILALGENLEYSIDSGSSWQSEPIFTDLDSGSYQIYVRASDATLCSDDSVASIGAPVPPVIDDILTTDPGDCAASDGSILVKMIGSDYEYSIDNGINWQSDSLFNDLPSGLYEISVRWANAIACIDEGTVSLYEPELPVINNISVFAPTDCGLADGRAIISATGDNLEYSIDNGVNWQSDSIFNMLAAGNYLIKVRTANAIGCEAEEMIAISSVNSPEILELNLEHVSDCGLSDGSIDISASGIDLEYSLDSISWQSSQIFENLDAGNYTVYTRSQSQPACLSFGLAIIEGPVYPQIVAVQVDSVSDCGQADARITIDANGESLEYSIDGGTTWQDNFEFVGLPAGIYDIQVREKGTLSCVDIAEVIFEDPDCDCGDITFDIESSDVSCYGMEDGSISILNVKGSDDYLISWNTGAQGNSVSGLSPGVYAFNIEYDKNCLFSDSIEINEPPVITFDTGVSPADCPGSPSGSIAVLNASGGFGQLLYSINNSIATADPLLTNLTNGEYEVGVVDENGCISSSIVQVGAENALIIELQELVESVLGDTIKLNPIVDLSRVDSFHWIPDPLQYNPANLSATFLVEEAGDVLLSVYYGSCIANAVSKIQINNQDIYVPSAFSPNNDGVNDRFFISADPVLSELTYQLQIYNRWGGKLFENPSARINHPEDGWDGKLNDKELLPGAYLYLIQITDQSGKVITRSGDVVIVR